MRKMILLSLVMAMAGLSQAETVIGVFADEGGTICDAAVVPYVATNIYVVAKWDPGSGLDNGITAAEFKLAGLPENAGYPIGMVTVHNTTDLIIGDLWTDYSAAWSVPMGAGAGMFVICRIEILSFDAGWIGPDADVVVSPGDTCDCLVLVDSLFEVHEAVGGLFTFNCSAPPCECYPNTAAQESNWSSVKALF